MATIKATVPAWLMDDKYDQTRFVALRADNKAEDLMGVVAFSASDMTAVGWTRIGTATIELTIEDDEAIQQNAVTALQEHKKTLLANAQREATRIDAQIQNLLAISCDEVRP